MISNKQIPDAAAPERIAVGTEPEQISVDAATKTPIIADKVSAGLRTVLDYLTSIPAWYLATCEGDQPHVRPFSFAALENGRLWFCTATTKDVYRELKANPKFELTAWKPGSGWIILRGHADLDDRAGAEVRRAGFDHLTALGEHYSGPDAPELTFFSMTDAHAWICDIDGSWEPLAL